MLNILNIIFHMAHLSVIIINLTFWISHRTLRLAQITQFVTLINWLGFGYYYGFGYCVLTDWHWQVKNKLGEFNLPNSYVKYVLDHLFNATLRSNLVDHGTWIVMLIAIVGCIFKSIQEIRGDSP